MSRLSAVKDSSRTRSLANPKEFGLILSGRLQGSACLKGGVARRSLVAVLGLALCLLPYAPAVSQVQQSSAPPAPAAAQQSSAGAANQQADSLPEANPSLRPAFQPIDLSQAGSSASAPADSTAAGADGTAINKPTFIDPLDAPPDHEKNSTLSMSPLRLGALIQIQSMRPLQLDASYNEPIALADVLEYTYRKSLPIKIARESVVFQEAQFAGQLANFLPNFAMSMTATRAHVFTKPVTNSTSFVFVPRLTYPIFLGGANVYSALSQYYRMKGWRETFKSNVNDALLSAFTTFTNLSLNHALLKIRAKAVEVSTAQVQLNKQLLASGVGTRFAVLQSESQLASDKQALLAQQIATRQSSLLLGYALDMPMAANLIPDKEYLSEFKLVDPRAPIELHLQTALRSRPELRQYEFFRFAAARNVQQAATSLYPSFSWSNSYTSSNTATHVHTSGNGAGGGNGTVAGAGIFGGLFQTEQNSLSLNWGPANLGFSAVANIVGARALSRQALLQANQELQLVREQVRSDYVALMSAREQIDTAAYGVQSSAEALRLADLRLRTGNGTNLELIQAERDYINALYTQAQAIIASNNAQAQLLHDMGVISKATLLQGYRP